MKCVNDLLKNRPFLILCLVIAVVFDAFLVYSLTQRVQWRESECVASGYTLTCTDIVASGVCYGTSWAVADGHCVVMGSTERLGLFDHAWPRAEAQFANVRVSRAPFVCWVRTCGAEYSLYEPFDPNGSIFTLIISLLLFMMVVLSGVYVYFIHKAGGL